MRLIDADALKKQMCDECFGGNCGHRCFEWTLMNNAPTVDAVEVVRCKDCIHKPTGSGVNHDITFPEQDYRCPCRCEDYWYSWMPYDDWFCANGDRK